MHRIRLSFASCTFGLIGCLLASVPEAQNFDDSDYNNIQVGTFRIDSATVLGREKVIPRATGANIVLSASTAGLNVDVIRRTDTGLVIASQTVAVSPSLVSVTFGPPFFNYDFKFSPTVPLTGSQSITGAVIQSR